MKKLLIFCMCFVPIIGWGQSKLSPYTQQLLDAVQHTSEHTHTLAPQRQTAMPEEVSAFIHLSNPQQGVEELKKHGIQVETLASKFATARFSLSKLTEIEQLESVTYIEIGTPVYPQMSEVKKSTRTDQVQAGVNLPEAFLGKNVVIGIIDNGFQYGHVNFWNKNRDELRVKRVWDQYKQGKAPAGFSYGTEYATQEEILQAAKDSTLSTHGSHVAGIAAGAAQSEENDYSGIAPEAELVFVSLNTKDMIQGNNAAVIDGINYIYQYAESVGKPCVVNLSLGSHLGPHDGTSTFDQMSDALQGSGKLLVGAVGNEATNKFHISKRFQEETPDTLKTLIDFKYMYDQHASIEIWGDKDMSYSFIPFVYSNTDKKIVATYPATELSTIGLSQNEYTFNEDKDKLIGSIKINGEISPNNNKPHMMVTASFFRSETHRIGFFITSQNQGSVHLWTDYYYSGFSNADQEEFTDGNDDCSMGEIGGTGKRIISVGASVSRDHYYRYGIYYPSKEKLDSLVSFSSHGPTADGRIKPEITAPGSYIISSLSAYYEGNKIKATPITFNGQKHEFGYMQGTSMASPAVAGILATWMQAKPDLTPEQAKDILQKTAYTDSFTGTISEEGCNNWGYGKIDAWNGLKECIQQTGIDAISNSNTAVIIHTDKEGIHLLSTIECPSFDIHLYKLNGTKVLADIWKNVNPAHEYKLKLNDPQQGVYILRISNKQTVITQKIIL